MKLFWTEPAIQDLRDLRDYIAADSAFTPLILLQA
jgi:plasmid stabilization system protein ParE